MKTNAIAFAFCASALLAIPALAQPAAPGPEMTKTLAENDKTIVTDNVLQPGESGPWPCAWAGPSITSRAALSS